MQILSVVPAGPRSLAKNNKYTIDEQFKDKC